MKIRDIILFVSLIVSVGLLLYVLFLREDIKLEKEKTKRMELQFEKYKQSIEVKSQKADSLLKSQK